MSSLSPNLIPRFKQSYVELYNAHLADVENVNASNENTWLP